MSVLCYHPVVESWASVVTAPGYLSVDFLFCWFGRREREKYDHLKKMKLQTWQGMPKPKRARCLRLGVYWNMNECCPTYDVKYNSLHQRTPIKRVINVELFFIFRLTEIGTGNVFIFILFILIFWHFRLEKHNQKVLETISWLSKGDYNNLWKPKQQNSLGTYSQFIQFLNFPHDQYVLQNLIDRLLNI